MSARVLRIIGIIFLLDTLVLAGVAIWLYSSARSFVDQAIPTQGTVVELRPSSHSSGTYQTVFEYRDQSGVTHRKECNSSSNPPSHAIGEKVEVLYSPSDPGDACLNDFQSLWALPLIAGFLAVFQIILGLGLIVLIPRVIRRTQPKPQSPN